MKLSYLGLLLAIFCTGCASPNVTSNPNSVATAAFLKNVPNFDISIPIFGHAPCHMENGFKICPSTTAVPSPTPFLEPPSSSQLFTGT